MAVFSSLGADQAGRHVRRRLHHVRTPEHGLLPGQVFGKIVEPGGQLPNGLARLVSTSLPGNRAAISASRSTIAL